MKLEIADAYGTSLIAILCLDGTPALAGEDYALWEGTYHKNGKWSYQEGGILLKNGIAVVQRKSTHRAYNNQKIAHVVMDDVRREEWIMGRFKETPVRPVRPENSPVPLAAWEAVIDAIVAGLLTPEEQEKIRAKWSLAAQFA